MRFKLDENFGRSAAARLRAAHHDVTTVQEEGLQGAPDRQVLNAAHAEQRCLVTLDVEFGNPLLFRPAEFSGIVVVRLPARTKWEHIIAALDTLTRAVAQASVAHKLWIIQGERVREYQPDQ